MSACKFIIPFSGEAQTILTKAKNAIEGQGGTFDGDQSSGIFDVSVLSNTIKGSYSVSGQDLTLVIDAKPFFIPCSTIESFLRSKLG